MHVKEEMDDTPKQDMLIIISDCNTKVGNKMESNVGRFGLGGQNEEWEQLPKGRKLTGRKRDPLNMVLEEWLAAMQMAASLIVQSGAEGQDAPDRNILAHPRKDCCMGGLSWVVWSQEHTQK